MKTSYVCGFPISFNFDQILMINKGLVKRTEMGTSLLWSGLGGKIKPKDLVYKPETKSLNILDVPPGTPIAIPSHHRVEDYGWTEETAHEAMAREFLEEAGYLIKRSRWHLFLIKEYTAARLLFFVCFMSPDELNKIIQAFKNHHSKEEGEVKTHNMVDILFDDEEYTFDIPYLMNFLMRESRRGFINKLDPEGLNSANAKS